MTDTTAPPPSGPTMDLDTATDKFIRLRDKIKEIKDRQKAELAPYNEMKEMLESWMLAQLQQMHLENATTKHGNVHKIKKDSATIEDMQSFWNWCVVTGDFDLVDRRANVVAIRNFIEKKTEEAKLDPNITPGPPPGVNFSSRYEVGVTRAAKKN